MSSIMLGVLASILPSFISVWLYSMRSDRNPTQLVRYFYLIEGLKFAGLAFLVSVFLQWPDLHIIKFFSAFVLSEMMRLFYQFFKLVRTVK